MSVACRVLHVHLPLVCVGGHLFHGLSRHDGGGGDATSQIGFLLPSVINLSVFVGLHLSDLLLQQCHCFCQFLPFFFFKSVDTPVRGVFYSGQHRSTHAKGALN